MQKVILSEFITLNFCPEKFSSLGCRKIGNYTNFAQFIVFLYMCGYVAGYKKLSGLGLLKEKPLR